jgi:hypothetical protein
MKYLKSILLISFLSLLVFSCTERIDIQLDDSYTRLVVDGSINTDTMIHTVELRTTSSYYYNEPAPMVSGAQLSITDGIHIFNLKENKTGVYQTDSSVYGVAGQTYTLNIKLANAIGGHSDYSAVSTLNPIVPLDSVSLLFHPEWAK